MRVVAVVVLVAVMVGLGASTGAQEGTPAAPEQCVIANGVVDGGGVCLNMIQVWPGVGEVDLYMDGNLFLAGLGFGAVSGLVKVAAGTHFLQATAAGAGLTEPLVDPLQVEVIAGVTEVALLGLGDEGLLLANAVDLTPLDPGSVRVRVIQALPDAPPVDLAVSGGEVWAADLGFSAVSEYQVKPAGPYGLELRPAGTTDVALPVPNLQFDGNTIQSVYLIGKLVDGTLRLLPVVTPWSQGAAATG